MREECLRARGEKERDGLPRRKMERRRGVSREESLRFAEGQRPVFGMDVNVLLGNGRGNKRTSESMNLREACCWFRTWRYRL